MKVRGWVATSLALFFCATTSHSERTAPFVPDEILIKFNHTSSHSTRSALKSKLGFSTVKTYPSLGLERVRIMSGRTVEESIRSLYKRAASGIEYAEPNYIVSADIIPNDPDFGELYGLHNTGQNNGLIDSDIDAPEAWDVHTGGEAVVAVIDTGVDYTHPDLAPNMWVNNGEIAGNGVDDDGNGFVDDYLGWDFYNNDNDPHDDHSHGTHVAGTIAAAGNNGIGIAGVCWQARIMPLKFLGSGGSGTTADAVEAILYAAAMGARVMNNSWGGGGYSQALKEAIETAGAAGSVFAAAAGNSGSDNDVIPHYPSSYDCQNIIAVAAADNSDALASFSCYGLESVDIGAPGSGILSAVPGGGYAYYSGTSMATPHVAGAAALAFSYSPSKNHTEVISDILSGADPVSYLEGRTVSGGRLNLLQTIKPEYDVTPPAAVYDLSVVESRMSRIKLEWTSTGDDGMSGSASSYDLRYSEQPITGESWNSAIRVQALQPPQESGSREAATITGMNPGTNYYIALKVKDNRHNLSALSNLVSAATAEGVLVLSDDVENGAGGWSAGGLWHRTAHRSYSGSSSWYYGQEGTWTYDTGDHNSGELTGGEIDLGEYEDAVLQFSKYRKVESYSGSYDICAVEASTDGGLTWETVWIVDSSSASSTLWVELKGVSLAGFAGSSVMIRFSFDTVDGSYNDYEGWYIDDIKIVAEDYSAGLVDIVQTDETIHHVELILNGQRFAAGDTHSLGAVIRRAELSPVNVCDAYLAVLDPSGAYHFLNPGKEWSNKAVPIAAGFRVLDMEVHVGSFIVPPGLAEGEYRWLGVLIPPGNSALRAGNWASELAESPFQIAR